jgi:hypothetical protein
MEKKWQPVGRMQTSSLFVPPSVWYFTETTQSYITQPPRDMPTSFERKFIEGG